MYTDKELSIKSALFVLWLEIELVSNPLQPNQTHSKREQDFSQTVVNESNRRTQTSKRDICRCINILNPPSVLINREPLQTFTGQVIQILTHLSSICDRKREFGTKVTFSLCLQTKWKIPITNITQSTKLEMSLLDSHIKRCH